MRTRMGFLYGTLVALLVIMGLWWTYFLTGETNSRADLQVQKMTTDRLHASFLLQVEPQLMDESGDFLRTSFPHLIFRHTADCVDVQIDPAVLASIAAEASSKRRMFLFEGLFFLLLLSAGSGILIYSWRSEVRYKQTRELFLSGVTHEFKTPLASLHLYTETMCREGLSETDRTRIGANMLEDMKRLENLVDDVLALSAGDTFARGVPVRLELLAEAQLVLNDLARFAADRGAEFTLVGETEAWILGNRMTLALALRNLLVNAVKHSPEPVRVTVTVASGAGAHQLIVSDDGPGIPRRLHSKVFECFYSGSHEGRRRGAGLGLHLVRQNIESLGGRIELDSEEGQGSTFTVTLPAAGKEG